ncbi:MAG: DNA (cytosine-5-)-methyltransferase, partial [Patescibacteria group bacterium]
LGYNIHYKIINAKNFVPQNRERILIVGFLDHTIDFTFPEIIDKQPKLKDIFEKNVDSKYNLTDRLWNYLQAYKEKHSKKGNGFGYSLADPMGTSRTLSARYYKDGSEILIQQANGNPRRLTPRECARLQGFPDSFKIPVSDTQAYKQFGNSVAVPLVTLVAQALTEALTPKEVPAITIAKPAYRKEAITLATA